MTEQQFPDDDVEGQKMLQDPEASEGDVEGHSVARDADDVEGHQVFTKFDDQGDDDDVAGHSSTPR